MTKVSTPNGAPNLAVNRRSSSKFWPVRFYSTAVGKKWVMALTGIMLMGFVFAHMIGNLKMYLGAEDIDAYGHALRTLLHPIMPDMVVLWMMRLGLIAALLLHLHAAITLTQMNRRARPVGYQSKRDYIAANFASRTMRWSGLIVLVFIFFHLKDLTFGTGGAAWTEEHIYANIDASLSRPIVAGFYILANLLLGIHLYHGAWSLFQSLGVNNPRYNTLRRRFAQGFAAIIVIGNVSFPIAVLAGVVGK
ncbi:MAG: succinate dehydrogenase cytochrome b subunit [Acidimicrobiia bacterium]